MRDRARPRWLEAQGWAVYTALSMPLFIDPDKDIDLIVDAVLMRSKSCSTTDDEPVVEVPERIADDEAADERLEEHA